MNAPRITPEHIAAQVVSVAYHRFPDTTVTVCCITLRNGFNTIGHSACVSAENFDQSLGEQIAYKNALNEIWALEGYLLREWLHMEATGKLQIPEGSGVPGDTYGEDRALVTGLNVTEGASTVDTQPSDYSI